MTKKKSLRVILWLVLALSLVYGAGRLYYRLTGGFTTSNITSSLPFDSRFETKSSSLEDSQLIDRILSQNFYYLGKGCQSYVFASEDGLYVIKFFKYQRFTPQEWLNWFSFIPMLNEHRLKKIEEKKVKLENIFTSWKIAFEELQQETGLVFIHLNKSNNLNKKLVIFDKIGLKHELFMDDYEFLIQKRASMLTDTIEKQMMLSQTDQAKLLIDRLFSTILSEYERGLGDNDHALMQNTGVLDGKPIHIDVGQFVKKETFKDFNVQAQEVFNKTYKFRVWLKKKYPELSGHLDEKLTTFIGPKINELKPQLKNMAADEL